jgi:hypothetical protein
MKMTEGATGVAHKLLQAIGTLPAKARLGLAAAAVGLPVMAYTLAGDPAPGGGEGGSGATAGQGGITHDVEVMDFSFVSAI